MRRLRIPVIYGATAAGKSALARALAVRCGGAVINGDAMQLYSNLRILTARPDFNDRFDDGVEHFLYGIVDGRHRASAGFWLELCYDAIAACRQADKVPIICGGSGLYIRALMHGLSPIPAIPPAIIESYKRRLQTEGLSALYNELMLCDSDSAVAIKPSDSQRILRALCVTKHSGKPFSAWHIGKSKPRLEFDFLPILHLPQRADLHASASRRLRGMVARGCLEEVAGLLQSNLSLDLPLMRAIGVREFAAYLNGACDFAEALRNAEIATRQYIKRQSTWARTQYSAILHVDRIIASDDSNSVNRIAQLLA